MSTFIVGLDENNVYRLERRMLTPEQCRAARGWLDWSQNVLASKAHVSLSTVRDFEKGRRQPISNNLVAIREALVAGGIWFTEDGIRGASAGSGRTTSSVHEIAQRGGEGSSPGAAAPPRQKARKAR
jgi:DNA-binding XRE family transcriptional regulator